MLTNMFFKQVRFIVFVTLPLGFASTAYGAAQQASAFVAAPPPQCAIRQPAWCVHEEGAEVLLFAGTAGPSSSDRVWQVRDPGMRTRDSVLIVFEPKGCRVGFADTAEAAGFEPDVSWHGRNWDRMRVRLKKNGSCDLSLMVPTYKADPFEWAFSNGRLLISACKDAQCTPNDPTPADVTAQYRVRFARKAGTSSL